MQTTPRKLVTIIAESLLEDRLVQELRKESDLEPEDRITLYLATPSKALQQAIDAHRDYIAGETLTLRWADSPPNGKAVQAKVGGSELTIALARAER